MQRQLPWSAALQASYIYLYRQSRYRLLFYNWRNRSDFAFTSTQPTFYKGVAIFPGVTFNQIDPNLFDANPAGRYDLAPAAQDGRPAERWALRIDPKRPTPRRSYYNALELQYTQRTKHGLSLQAAFTWSRNIDRGRRRRTSERVT